MIRNLCTCGAYAIRPYPDGRKGLFLRSIWGYEKLYDLFFDLKNDYGKCIDHLFESKKDHAKRHIGYFCRGVLHTPPQDTLKSGVWSESRYMWGVFNTHLPLRTERSISKINFLVMRNGMTSFLIRKMVMQNRLYLYWDRESGMRSDMTIFWS